MPARNIYFTKDAETMLLKLAEQLGLGYSATVALALRELTVGKGEQ